MQGRSSALHVGKAENTAYYACYGRFQGYPCTQPSVPDRRLEAQLDGFFAAFVLPPAEQQRLLELYEQEQQRALPESQQGPNAAQRRAQSEARLERQRHLYELGDWTRESYLEARQVVLAELAELDTETPAQDQAPDADAIARLCDYVRELGTAWRAADKPNKRLLVRTLFEQLWVVGDRIIAAKPVAQFAPFFRLIRNLNGEDPEQRYYLAPGVIWELEEMELAAGQVSDAAKEIAHDLGDHGQLVVTHSQVSHGVQTSGPDGPITLTNHTA